MIKINNEIITAVYEDGVFKPLQDIRLRNHQKVKIMVEPDLKWQKEFRKLLKKIHQRTAKFSSQEIERDITLASRQIKRK